MKKKHIQVTDDFWIRLNAFMQKIQVDDTLAEEKSFIVSVCSEKTSGKNCRDSDFECAIETFRKAYPNVTSADLQAFAIGWKSKNINSGDSLAHKLLTELMMQQEELICSPIRFNGVSTQKIKQIFERHGVSFDVGF